MHVWIEVNLTHWSLDSGSSKALVVFWCWCAQVQDDLLCCHIKLFGHSFVQWPYHAHKFQISINWQGRSTSYIWLAFALISLLNRKRDSRKRWKKGGTPDFPVKGAGMRDPWTRIRHLYFFTVHLVCLPKFCITFVFNVSWGLHSSKEKLKRMLTVFTRKTPGAY